MESIMNYLYSVTLQDENYIGKGSFAKVYNVPGMDNYVLRVEHGATKEVFEGCPIVKVADEFPDDNFGQKVADNFHGVTILKKVYGQPLGFDNPQEKDDPAKFLPVHARLVLAQIKEISAYPLDSYENLARKIKKINQSKILMLDFANSNNILVDNINKEFNLLDLSERTQVKELQDIVHDKTELVSLLTNACFHIGVFERLTSDEQKSLNEHTAIVIAKCRQAAANMGLTNSTYTGFEKFKRLNDYCRRVLSKECFLDTRYKAFEEMYRDWM